MTDRILNDADRAERGRVESLVSNPAWIVTVLPGKINYDQTPTPPEMVVERVIVESVSPNWAHVLRSPQAAVGTEVFAKTIVMVHRDEPGVNTTLWSNEVHASKDAALAYAISLQRKRVESTERTLQVYSRQLELDQGALSRLLNQVTSVTTAAISGPVTLADLRRIERDVFVPNHLVLLHETIFQVPAKPPHHAVHQEDGVKAQLPADPVGGFTLVVSKPRSAEVTPGVLSYLRSVGFYVESAGHTSGLDKTKTWPTVTFTNKAP